jgi:hypothetical protein
MRDEIILIDQPQGKVMLNAGGVLVALVPSSLPGENNSYGRQIGMCSIWRHVDGFILCTEPSIAGMGERIVLAGDPQNLIDVGVADRRDHRRSQIDRLIGLVGPGREPSEETIPFLVADDPFDAAEVVAAAAAYFLVPEWAAEWPSIVFRTSKIESWHPLKLDHQCIGGVDVAVGLSALPQDVGQTDEDWVAAVGQVCARAGARAVLISGAEHLGLADHGPSFNFVDLLNSAVDTIQSWGMSAAVHGSWQAWWALLQANNGPSPKHFELVHVPADPTLSEAFLAALQARCHRRAELRPVVAQAVWQGAQGNKGLAMMLLESALQVAAQGGRSQLEIDDVDMMLGGIRRAGPEGAVPGTAAAAVVDDCVPAL